MTARSSCWRSHSQPVTEIAASVGPYRWSSFASSRKKEAILEAWRKHFGAAHDETKAPAVASAWSIEKTLQQRRNEVGHRDPAIGDETNEISHVEMPARTREHDACAKSQRPEQFLDRNVERKRRLLQHAVASLQAPVGLQPEEVIDQRTVIDQRSLGGSGRPRGVHHTGDVPRFCRRRSEPFFTVRVVDDGKVSRKWRHPFGKPALHEHQRRLAIGQNLTFLVGREVWIDRDVSRAAFENAENANQQIERSFGAERHACTPTHPTATQKARQAVRSPIELAIRQPFVFKLGGVGGRCSRNLPLDQPVQALFDVVIGGRRVPLVQKAFAPWTLEPFNRIDAFRAGDSHRQPAEMLDQLVNPDRLMALRVISDDDADRPVRSNERTHQPAGTSRSRQRRRRAALIAQSSQSYQALRNVVRACRITRREEAIAGREEFAQWCSWRDFDAHRDGATFRLTFEGDLVEVKKTCQHIRPAERQTIGEAPPGDRCSGAGEGRRYLPPAARLRRSARRQFHAAS